MALVVFGLVPGAGGGLWWNGKVKLPDATEVKTAIGLQDLEACVVVCEEVTDAKGTRSVCKDVCRTTGLNASGDNGAWSLFGQLTFFLGLLAVALAIAVAAVPGALDARPGMPRTIAMAASAAWGATMLCAIAFIALAPSNTPALWLGAHAFLIGGALCTTVSLRGLTGAAEVNDAGEGESAFAGDPPIARTVRSIDKYIGLAEQVTLFSILIFLVLGSFAWFTLGLLKAPKAWGLLDENIDGVGVDIRYGVFLSAMVGGAFATHHRRLLSMDIVSRVIGARSRAWLRIGLTLFAVEMALVFFSYGQVIAHETGKERAIEHWIPASVASSAIAIGALLVTLHLLHQIVIDLDYLLRGKTPPEPEQGVA